MDIKYVFITIYLLKRFLFRKKSDIIMSHQIKWIWVSLYVTVSGVKYLTDFQKPLWWIMLF